jgi:hypothetical protein
LYGVGTGFRETRILGLICTLLTLASILNRGKRVFSVLLSAGDSRAGAGGTSAGEVRIDGD